MKNIIIVLSICTLIISCSYYEVEQPQQERISYDVNQNITPEITYETLPDTAESCLKGLVLSTRGDTVKFGNIVLVKDEIGVTGGQTDEFGEFKICNIEPGIYDVKITGVTYYSAVIKDVEIKENTLATISKVGMAATSV